MGSFLHVNTQMLDMVSSTDRHEEDARVTSHYITHRIDKETQFSLFFNYLTSRSLNVVHVSAIIQHTKQFGNGMANCCKDLSVFIIRLLRNNYGLIVRNGSP